MSKYKKKITNLNDSPKFQAMMSYEERQRLEINTEKRLAYEDGMEQDEKQKQLEIAKSLLTTELSLQNIALHNGLSIEEIKKLQN